MGHGTIGDPMVLWPHDKVTVNNPQRVDGFLGCYQQVSQLGCEKPLDLYQEALLPQSGGISAGQQALPAARGLGPRACSS